MNDVGAALSGGANADGRRVEPTYGVLPYLAMTEYAWEVYK